MDDIKSVKKESKPPVVNEPPQPEKAKSNTILFLMLLIGGIVLVLGGMYVFLGGSTEEDGANQTESEQVNSAEVVEYEYSEQFINNYTTSCINAAKQNGVTDPEVARSYCECTLSEIRLTYPEEEFLQIERVISEDPDNVPPQLLELVATCHAQHIPDDQTKKLSE